MAGELIIKNGLQVSGSIIADSVTGSFSGSFVGSVTDAVSASYAATASYVNPLTQSVSIRGTGITDATTALLVENANASGSLVVLDDGNVGIGTTSPTVKFDVLGSATSSVSIVGQFIGGTGTAAGGMKFGAYSAAYGGFWPANVTPTTSNYALISSGADTGLNSTFAINFYINNSSIATVRSTGLGIGTGTVAPTSRLQVKGSGTTSATTALLVENSSASPSLVVRDDGRVGIGTSTIYGQVEIYKNSYAEFRLRSTSDAYATLQFEQYGTTGAITSNSGSLILSAGRFSKVGDLRMETSGSITRVIIKDNGNVGIGTNSPRAKLDIQDSTHGTLMLSRPSETGYALISGSSGLGFEFKTYDAGQVMAMKITNNGNVGIGTTSPSYKLDVSGSGRFSSNVQITGSTTNSLLVKGSGTTSGTTALLVENANASASLLVRDDGNVGIGTTSPVEKLHINGNVRIGLLGNQGYYLSWGQNVVGSTGDFARIYGIRTDGAGNQAGHLVFQTKNAGSGTTPTERLRITDTGNILIGTTTDGARLRVKGSGTTSATTSLLVENANASASLLVRDDGNVGVGTNSPTYKLHISSSNNGDGLAIHYPSTNSALFPFYLGTSIQSNYLRANHNILELKRNGAASTVKTVGSNNNLALESATDLVFNTNGANERMRITNTGNVGIGTTAPSYKLDVSGSGRFTDGLTVTGSLIAPSITGSLFGTSSYATQALSASYAPGGATFPYTGSAEISGSLIVTGATIVQDGAIGIVSTGTTSATTAFEVKNATPEDLFIVKDDGELNINTTKYANNGVLTNSGGTVTEVAGWTGMININTTPPIMIDVQNGIIVNVT